MGNLAVVCRVALFSGIQKLQTSINNIFIFSVNEFSDIHIFGL